MTDRAIISGQQSSWVPLKKLAEGDAGEVYLVEALMGSRQAILKRAQKNAFASDAIRQAAQIRAEEKILKSLHALLGQNPALKAGVPEVLDQSKVGSDFDTRFFIVIEKAPGFDLSFLRRVSQLGIPVGDTEIENLGPEERLLLASIAKRGKIPDRILLSILTVLIDLLERIHQTPLEINGSMAQGIIWNDVKPDHLFWNAWKGTTTIVDWGNAQALELDGTSANRQFSTGDDFRQLIDEMGRFLSSTAPELAVQLAWPEPGFPEAASLEGILALRGRVQEALQAHESELSKVRARETAFLKGEAEGEGLLSDLSSIQQEILAYGEIPDYPGGMRFAASLAARLVLDDRLEELRGVCDWTLSTGLDRQGVWNLVDLLARITGRSEGAERALFLDAIQAAICGDGEAVLWNLLTAIQDYPEPDWWSEVTTLVRRMQLDLDEDGLRPWVTINRYLLSLQATARRIQERETSRTGDNEGLELNLPEIQGVIRRLKEETVPKWFQWEPPPPHAGLAYDDITEVLKEAGGILPDEHRVVERALSQPRAQVKIVLDAWERKDFLVASKGLRRALVWDPERRRILQAEVAIRNAPTWLKRVHIGPQPDDHFMEFITSLEFEGRELRNRVGPAPWLDLILDACRKLRKGTWPADLLQSSPDLLREMPWLRKYERYERVPPLLGEGEAPRPGLELEQERAIQGVISGKLGADRDMLLVEPLDAWAPEARGSSARVYAGILRSARGQLNPAAIKLMRMDKVEYALPLFREEVHILSIMKAVPGMTELIECGFIRFDEQGELPSDNNYQAAQLLTGDLLRIGPGEAPEFLDRLEERVSSGWMPYLALKQREHQNNLLSLCDAGLNRGRFLPLADLLQMSIQICDILQIAHQRNIVYRDHKILHYYWEADSNGVYIIDWNVARHHPMGVTSIEVQMDLVQFGARGLHHILTGRSAPGALPLGPTRPEEIDQAAPVYHTQWTYDDQRLPQELRDVLTRVLLGEYSDAVTLREDLKHACMQLP